MRKGLLLTSTIIIVILIIISQSYNYFINLNKFQSNELGYPNIAFVKPTFTSAAYSGFYDFYKCIANKSCSSSDGYKYLIRNVPDAWGTSVATKFIEELISEGYPNTKIHIITDQDVHLGKLYDKSGKLKYSSIVFFHSEYVTFKEYYNTLRFLQSGGNVIMLNGNAFYAEVDYNPTTNLLYLTAGHYFQFDGVNGTELQGGYRYWGGIDNNENFKYIGSRYSAFRKGTANGADMIISSNNPHPIALELQKLDIKKIAPNYKSHEENSLITPNVHLIALWDINYVKKDRGYYIYEYFPFGPKSGSLIHFSFYGTDILESDYPSRVAFVVAVRHQAGLYNIPWIKFPEDGGVYNFKNLEIDFTKGYETKIFLNGKQVEKNSPSFENIAEGDYNLTIEFFTSNQIIKRAVYFAIDRKSPNINANVSKNGKTLNINVLSYDDHIESLNLYICNRNHVYYDMRKNVSATTNYFSNNVSIELKQNGTYIIEATAFDSAGNYKIDKIIFPYNINGNDSWFYNNQPVFKQINATTGYVKIPKMSSNLTPYLEYSKDYGKNWTIESMIYNSTSLYYTAYISKTTNFWYRIAVTNGSEVYYYTMMRSYYWDSDFSIFNNSL